MSNKQTPSCAICEWRNIIDYAIIGRRDYCEAQAMMFCRNVYNNKECQKLFKIKKEKEKEK